MKFTQEISIFNPKAIEYAVTALGTRITQTAEEIRLEAEETLSNYSTTIQMNSAISQKADQITTEVSQTYATQRSQASAVSSLSSRIAQTAHTIEIGVTGKAGKTSGASITVTLKDANGRTISDGSGNVLIDGNVIFSSQLTDGTTTISGSNIKTGTISADRIGANSISVSKLTGNITNGNWKIDLDNGTFTIGDMSANNITTGTLTGRDISGGRIIQTVVNPQHGGISGNDSDGQQAKIENGIVTCGELAVKGSVTTVSIVPEGGDGRGSYGLYCTGHFSTEGALWTNGSIGEADIICRGNAFANNFIQSSDRALKTDIEPLAMESACSVVYGLKPMTFRLKEQTEVKRHGFIAQDVQGLVHDDWGIVTESDVKLIDGRPTLALNYTELIADLVAVIQSQNKRITELERRA